MVKYGIHLETPSMNPDELAASSYVLIRHGLSEYNFKSLESKHAHGDKSAEFRAV